MSSPLDSSPLDGLLGYIPVSKTGIAHLIRHFPETGEVYIFCNRHLSKPSGAIYSLEELALKYSATPICGKCQAAIEAAIERFGVLQGLHPAQMKEAGNSNG